MNQAIFLDRDGTINVKAPREGYIVRPEQFIFIPGALNAIVKLSKSQYRIIIVTNQRCIGKGILTDKELYKIHGKMVAEIRENGGRIDDIYYCPHTENDNCTCRKPLPGMLDFAKMEHHIDFSKSWMIGDHERDIHAGRARGCRTIYIGKEKIADYRVNSLQEAVDIII